MPRPGTVEPQAALAECTFSLLPSWVTGWRDPKADHMHVHAMSQGPAGSRVVGDKKCRRCCSRLNGGPKTMPKPHRTCEQDLIRKKGLC